MTPSHPRMYTQSDFSVKRSAYRRFGGRPCHRFGSSVRGTGSSAPRTNTR